MTIRRSAIPFTDSSFRPRMELPKTPITLEFLRALDVHFVIPTDEEFGNPEQLEAVMAFKAALCGLSNFIGQPKVAFDDSRNYVVKLPVSAPAANYDKLLSWFFYTAYRVIEASSVLKDGFCDRKPYWKATMGGDFKAAAGTFELGGYKIDPEAPDDAEPADESH